MVDEINCFKAYDVRGRVPDQLNEDVAYRIGRAYVEFLRPKRVVVGYDIRLSSQPLCAALTRGLTESGADVTNIGQCGTEEVYFATSHLNADGGIVVTASHNPAEYNGLKFLQKDGTFLSPGQCSALFASVDIARSKFLIASALASLVNL